MYCLLMLVVLIISLYTILMEGHTHTHIFDGLVLESALELTDYLAPNLPILMLTQLWICNCQLTDYGKSNRKIWPNLVLDPKAGFG